jgi:hypothetical protein
MIYKHQVSIVKKKHQVRSFVKTASYRDTEKNECVHKKWRKEDKWSDYHLLVTRAS